MIIMTFDTDHMTENMMAVFLNEIVPKALPATFFCYKVFDCLVGASQEVAMHPSFAEGEAWLPATRKLQTALADKHDVVPRGLRPHSLMSSQRYVVDLNGLGFEYISSISVPSAVDIACFRYPWGPVEIPVRYMDNMDLWARDKTHQTTACFEPRIIADAVTAKGVFCFDFHPVHIYLNTSRFEDYEEWVKAGRPELSRPIERAAYGTRDFFFDVCEAAAREGLKMLTCLEAARATP